MYISYIDLLNAVDKDGELVSPSNVSVNRSFETKELNNVQLEINDFKQLLINDDEVRYYEKELLWYFDSYEKPKHLPLDLNHDKWESYPVIKEDTFVKDLRRMAEEVIGCKNRCGDNSNYGSMMLRLENHIGITQKQWIIEKLSKDKNSRQAIAFYNTPNYQYWSNSDFVCCLTQMFNIKGNKLNSVVNSRSNDLINSFRFDVIWWHLFQKIIFNELKKVYPDLQMGYLFINIFSAHFYLKDSFKLELIRECSDKNSFKNIDLEKFEILNK